jgi:hypothetical protein
LNASQGGSLQHPVITGVSVCVLTLLLNFSSLAQSSSSSLTTPSQAQVAEDHIDSIPKFHSESRQILLEASVWQKTNASASWVPKDMLKKHSLFKPFWTSYPPAQGLTAKDFRIYENGIAQAINYFKEIDSATTDLTGGWDFLPDIHGTWGFFMDFTAAPMAPEARYVIGYVPHALTRGECRALQVTIEGKLVYANKDRYCASDNDGSIDNILGSAKLSAQMRKLARSDYHGFSVSLHVHAFWSSGVLSLATDDTARQAEGAEQPTGDYLYRVEVHDSQTPATVHITLGLPRFKPWDNPCPKDAPAMRVLGLIFTPNGELATQFADKLACRSDTFDLTPYMQHPGLWWSLNRIPDRFDTQVELAPGDYELDVIASVGSEMGRARIPVHVEPLDPKRLMISDIVVAGVVRDAKSVLLDTARVMPHALIPSPLVSNDSQFFTDSDKTILLPKNGSLYVYFEVYRPATEARMTATQLRWRIVDQKTSSAVKQGQPLDASAWVDQGNVVIPVGLKLSTENLRKGSFALEIQALSSGGDKTEWRAAKFNVR